MAHFIRLDEETISNRLEAIFSRRLPRASQPFNLLQFYLRGITENVKLPTEFYWYNALELEESCIAAKISKPLKNTGITEWVILAPEKEQREAMMEFGKIVNWDQPNSFNFLDDAIVKPLTELCREHGGPSFNPWGYLYSMPIEKALKLDVADGDENNPGVTIEPLQLEEIAMIMEYWKFADNQEPEEVIGCVRTLPSAGLHVDGKLVSWAFTGIDGGIHNVFTLEEYRGRGYGKLLLKYLCRKLAETGIIPVVHAEGSNDASNAMMKKVGFELSHSVTWLNL